MPSTGTLAGRALIAAVVVVGVVWWLPAEWRHRQWKKQFDAKWKRRLAACIALDSKIEDELCQDRVLAWMMRQMDEHPPPTIWNGFK
jgi:hypothetical protein